MRSKRRFLPAPAWLRRLAVAAFAPVGVQVDERREPPACSTPTGAILSIVPLMRRCPCRWTGPPGRAGWRGKRR